MTERLLLDEHYSPAIAAGLRQRGFDVVAVLDLPALRTCPDDEVFRQAQAMGRRVVTENVSDFLKLLSQSYERDTPVARLLLVSAKSHPRGRAHVGTLVDALAAWLDDGRPRADCEWL
ncbi:MAG: DUF5615 family PIN-like protein [Propionibacteriaceae bacterium]|jgi:predicted nuclease of predicted toxin-antitoxin system|nr:DUF5615 family PIN-like protein [Propionibacteriaceae bacterium]